MALEWLAGWAGPAKLAWFSNNDCTSGAVVLGVQEYWKSWHGPGMWQMGGTGRGGADLALEQLSRGELEARVGREWRW